MDYAIYHYKMEDINDVGFGCSYRNIQTILSCYSVHYDQECIIPNIRDILEYFEKEYMRFIETNRTRSLWIEPVQISKYLENYTYLVQQSGSEQITKPVNIKCKNYIYIVNDSDTSKMLRTDIQEYIKEDSIYTKSTATFILTIMIDHFKNSKLPIVIDDGVYSYCIGNITGSPIIDSNIQSFSESGNPLSLTILDPHTTQIGGKIYKKNIYWFINSFWMISIPN